MRRSILKRDTQQEINEEIMSDGTHKMWEKFNDYVEVCNKLGIDHLSIDDNWMDHWFNVTE